MLEAHGFFSQKGTFYLAKGSKTQWSKFSFLCNLKKNMYTLILLEIFIESAAVLYGGRKLFFSVMRLQEVNNNIIKTRACEKFSVQVARITLLTHFIIVLKIPE